MKIMLWIIALLAILAATPFIMRSKPKITACKMGLEIESNKSSNSADLLLIMGNQIRSGKRSFGGPDLFPPGFNDYSKTNKTR